LAPFPVAGEQTKSPVLFETGFFISVNPFQNSCYLSSGFGIKVAMFRFLLLGYRRLSPLMER
jgi:hypothetical protein